MDEKDHPADDREDASPDPVKPESLAGDNPAPHVDPEDVDAFLELSKSGVLPEAVAGCGAVQDNRALRHDTRTPLEEEGEGEGQDEGDGDAEIEADKPVDDTPTDDKPEDGEPGN